MDKFEGGTYVAAFSACNVDLSQARRFIDAYNNDRTYSTSGSRKGLFYEHEYHGVLIVPIDDLARLYEQTPEVFDKFFEDHADLASIVKEVAEGLSDCEPLLIGQAMGTGPRVV